MKEFSLMILVVIAILLFCLLVSSIVKIPEISCENYKDYSIQRIPARCLKYYQQ